MIRKICVEGKKRQETNGSFYCHNSYFIYDFTNDGVPDDEIVKHIAGMLSRDMGVPVDVICFMEINDCDNQFATPNDIVDFSESSNPFLAGVHRFVICDDDLFKEYLRTGENA